MVLIFKQKTDFDENEIIIRLNAWQHVSIERRRERRREDDFAGEFVVPIEQGAGQCEDRPEGDPSADCFVSLLSSLRKSVLRVPQARVVFVFAFVSREKVARPS